MAALCFANAFAVLSAIWALWVRRYSFGSSWDGAISVGVALYGLGSALESPWPAVAAASFPLTGKYYLLPVLGNISYLAGTAMGLKSFYVRLLPDAEIGRFMRMRIMPVVVAAGTVMLLCAVASPMTATMPADHLYLVPLDGWLRMYFITYFVSVILLLGAAVFGGFRLLGGQSSGAAVPLMVIASVGSLACLGHLVAILTVGGHRVWMLALFGGYLATTVTALVCAVSWQRRIGDLTQPPSQR